MLINLLDRHHLHVPRPPGPGELTWPIEELPLCRDRAPRRSVAGGCGGTRSARRCASGRRSSGSCCSRFLVFLAVFAPLIAPYEPNEVVRDEQGLGTASHRASTCSGGATTTSRSTSSGSTGTAATSSAASSSAPASRSWRASRRSSFAVVIGTLIGLVAGFYGEVGRQRSSCGSWTCLLAFPALLLAITIVTVLGRGLFNAVIAISAVTIPVYARVVRASVLSVREHGLRDRRPRAWRLEPAASSGTGSCRTRSRRSSCKRRSASPPRCSRSRRCRSSASACSRPRPSGDRCWPTSATRSCSPRPHLVFFPGLFIMLNVLAFNLIGDGFRDALDPRLNR